MRRRIGLLAPLLALCVVAASMAAERNPVRQRPAASSEPAAQRLLVKFKDTVAAPGSNPGALAQRRGVKLLESHPLIAGLHAMRVEPASAAESVQTTLARLRADPTVQYAEVDQRRYAHALPNDPLYAGQWYMHADASAIASVNAAAAWDRTTGTAGLVIAELDTGVLYDHPDLLRADASGRLLPGYDFISDPIVANDGNGRDADASDPGDWVSSADVSAIQGCTSADIGNSSWHGTRVAGILGAATNNGLGIAGINWSGWILPVRVLGKCGGSDSDIMAAMLWAAGLHVDGVPDNQFPARIINLSLGGTGACPAGYQTVLSQLAAAGVLVVASAGNEGGPVDAPANCAGVAGIAGLRHLGTKVGFSSLGPEIALSAPGGNCVNASGPCLYSIDTSYNTGTTVPATNSYTDQSIANLGTSFSAPIVAGIAGLMKAANGNLNSAQLIARLREGATVFPTTSTTTPAPPSCHVPANASDVQNIECICTAQTCGAGMANADGALAAAFRPIAAIAVNGGVAAGQTVVLRGTGSAAACGHTLSSYAWSIVNPGSGAPTLLNASAPIASIVAPAIGSVTVRLTVTDDSGRTDSADIVVSANAATTSAPASAGSSACLPLIRLDASGVVSVSVAPATASLVANGTQVFVATVINTGILPVTWQVNGVTGGNSTVGTISANGLYTAPAVLPTPATVTITATTTSASVATATAQVTVTSAFPVGVSPADVNVTTGMTQGFSATVAGTASTAVTWQVDGIAGGSAAVGTINSSGLYTAPAVVPSPATVQITAVSVDDPGSSATVAVTVVAATSTGTGSAATAAVAAGGGGGGALDGLGLVLLGVAALRPRRRRLGSTRRHGVLFAD